MRKLLTGRSIIAPTTANGSGQADYPAPPAPAVEALLWTLSHVAVATSLSSRTIKRLVAERAIPGIVRVGRALRFDRRKVEEWISRGCPRQDRRHGRT
jgi:excisionase family DNA binding protein